MGTATPALLPKALTETAVLVDPGGRYGVVGACGRSLAAEIFGSALIAGDTRDTRETLNKYS